MREVGWTAAVVATMDVAMYDKSGKSYFDRLRGLFRLRQPGQFRKGVPQQSAIPPRCFCRGLATARTLVDLDDRLQRLFIPDFRLAVQRIQNRKWVNDAPRRYLCN